MNSFSGEIYLQYMNKRINDNRNNINDLTKRQKPFVVNFAKKKNQQVLS